MLGRRYGTALRKAAVAEFEVRLRVGDNSGAWRLVVSSPTGVTALPLIDDQTIVVSLLTSVGPLVN